jgi:hypothetical protein
MDFSNHPVSIAEVKSNRSNNAREIPTRDLLIELLRQIDKGEVELNAVVIGMQHTNGDVGFRCASPSFLTTLGILTFIKGQMLAKLRG